MVLIGLTAHILQDKDRWNGRSIHAAYEMETRWVQKAGGSVCLLPPLAQEDEAQALVGRLDGLILLGGGDLGAVHYGGVEGELVRNVNPERDRSEIALTRAALAQGLPLLAICRGVQLLNAVLGGTLVQDIPTQWPGALDHNLPGGIHGAGANHDITLEHPSKLAHIFGASTLYVNSYHHQGLDRLGAGLNVTAKAPDGMIEGVELEGHPFCIGVQWHPEKAEGNREDMLPLFGALVEAGRAFRGGRS